VTETGRPASLARVLAARGSSVILATSARPPTTPPAGEQPPPLQPVVPPAHESELIPLAAWITEGAVLDAETNEVLRPDAEPSLERRQATSVARHYASAVLLVMLGAFVFGVGFALTLLLAR
ncbi:MAG TPA: hypothetical protein VK427_25800, partial [Kofleriaceae bacterium]|nr:hypothetical protein [Kofleriaceae bacterium]